MALPNSPTMTSNLGLIPVLRTDLLCHPHTTTPCYEQLAPTLTQGSASSSLALGVGFPGTFTDLCSHWDSRPHAPPGCVMHSTAWLCAGCALLSLPGGGWNRTNVPGHVTHTALGHIPLDNTYTLMAVACRMSNPPRTPSPDLLSPYWNHPRLLV
jgi:hypothetical protein